MNKILSSLTVLVFGVTCGLVTSYSYEADAQEIEYSKILRNVDKIIIVESTPVIEETKEIFSPPESTVFRLENLTLKVTYPEPLKQDDNIVLTREQFNKPVVVKEKVLTKDGNITESSLGAINVLECLPPLPPDNDYLLQEWPARVRNMILQEFPEVDAVYGSRPGDPQDHGKGLALDVMVPVGSDLGDEVNAWLEQNFTALNINYLIWEQKILLHPHGTWKHMEDRGNDTTNHFDHVHISFNHGKGFC